MAISPGNVTRETKIGRLSAHGAASWCAPAAVALSETAAAAAKREMAAREGNHRIFLLVVSSLMSWGKFRERRMISLAPASSYVITGEISSTAE